MSSFIITGFSDEINENIEKQFEHLNKLGILYFEPRGINGVNISDLTDRQVEELKKAMENHKITASSIGSPIGKIKITDDFEPHLKKLDRVIEIAKALGTKYIRIFSFFIPENYNPTDYRDEVMFRMKEMTRLAIQKNVFLLHENERNIYGDNALRCEDILDTVNSPNLQAVFDPANFVLIGQKVYPEAYNLLSPYIKYVHIKDAVYTTGIVPPGMGEGNIPEVLERLHKAGYEGFLSLEPHLGNFKGLADMEGDKRILELSGSTPEKFTLAYNSLMNIINKKGNKRNI